MSKGSVTVQVRGKAIAVSSQSILGQTIITNGKFVKIATIMDEEFLDREAVLEPGEFIAELNRVGTQADIFTFAEKVPNLVPKHKYHIEWDNFAVIPITSFAEWCQTRVERDARKAINRAHRLGVVVKVVQFDDAFAEGIQRIYNESPVRQGKPFWHYQKDLETIKRENSTYSERSVCIGAYYQEELIGFIRMLHVGSTAMTFQVISMMRHSDKKPTNALIAKAVEYCESRKLSHLVYGRFLYNNLHSSLTEFKRRNGFEPLLVPRYYVPLSAKGAIALKLGLHLPVGQLLPPSLLTGLKKIRSLWNCSSIKTTQQPS